MKGQVLLMLEAPRPHGGSSQIGQGGLHPEEKCKDFDTSSGVWGAGRPRALGYRTKHDLGDPRGSESTCGCCH